MATQNSGYQRMTALQIQTVTNGVLTKTYVLSFESTFTQAGVVYPAIADTDVQTMSFADYQSRVSAFAAYVQANYQTQYPGLTVSGTGSYVQNTTACPLP